LEGHTESKGESGSDSHDAWDLSTDRANAARRILMGNGVLDKQISKISGFADTLPMAGYEPTDEINRRVTVLLRLKESVDALSNTSSSERPTEVPNDTPSN
jgi:chemotaxis protein MotB